jgi:hypothetical protein
VERTQGDITHFDLNATAVVYAVRSNGVHVARQSHPLSSFTFPPKFGEFSEADVADFTNKAGTWNPTWVNVRFTNIPYVGVGGGVNRTNKFPTSNTFDLVTLDGAKLNTYHTSKRIVYDLAQLTNNDPYNWNTAPQMVVEEYPPALSEGGGPAPDPAPPPFLFRGWQVDNGAVFVFREDGTYDDKTKATKYIGEVPLSMLRANATTTYALTTAGNFTIPGMYTKEEVEADTTGLKRPIVVRYPMSDNPVESYRLLWVEQGGEPVILAAGDGTTHRVFDSMGDLTVYKCSYDQDRDYEKKQQFVVKIEQPTLLAFLGGLLAVKTAGEGDVTAEVEITDPDKPPEPEDEGPLPDADDYAAIAKMEFEKSQKKQEDAEGVPESQIGGVEEIPGESKRKPLGFLTIPKELRPKIKLTQAERAEFRGNELNLEIKALTRHINIVILRSVKTYHPGEYPLSDAETPDKVFKARQHADKRKAERETIEEYEGKMGAPHERAIWMIFGDHKWANTDEQVRASKEFG